MRNEQMRKRAKKRKNIIQEVVNLSEESKMKISPAAGICSLFQEADLPPQMVWGPVNVCATLCLL